MSPAFTFPPPPPPPPKATANVAQSQNDQKSSRRGGRGHLRGTGRGSLPQYGQRPSQQPIVRYQDQPPHGYTPNHGNWSNAASSSHGNTEPKRFPGQNCTHNTPKASHTDVHYTKNRYQDPDSPEQQPTYTPPLFQKRKHEALNFANSEPKARPEKKPKVQPAPQVPMFGAPLPSFVKPSVPTYSAEKSPKTGLDVKSKKRKRKRETNQLGLTPAGEDHEASDEDIDEEAMFASLGVTSRNLLQFEYEGQVSTLGSSADIKAWIEQRRQNFPTQARVAQRKARAKQLKEAKEVTRQRELENTRQKVVESQRSKTQEQTDRTISSQDAKGKKRIEKHIAKAEKLRRNLSSVKKPSSITRNNNLALNISPNIESRNANDEGSNSTDTDSQDGTGPEELALKKMKPFEEESNPALVNVEAHNEGVFPKGAVVDDKEKKLHNLLAQYGSDISSNSDSSEDFSDESSVVSSSSDSDLDEAKTAEPSERDDQTKPDREQDFVPAKHDMPRGVCHHYYLKGSCNKGRSCKFRHVRMGSNPRPARKSFAEPAKRQSLYQKLVAKEKEQENQAVLQAIKLLGDNGLLDD